MSDETVPATTRRTFLLASGVLAAGAAASPLRARALPVQQEEPPPQQNTDGEPPDDAQRNGEITLDTFIEAEKLAGVRFTGAERRQMLETISEQIELITARMEAFTPVNDLAPASIFDPRLPGFALPFEQTSVTFTDESAAPLPESEDDIAFAPVTQQAAWLRRGELTSTALTELYLRRLRTIGPNLECVITLMEARALEQAAQADAELAQGIVRSPVHGIPWGAKDLLDTAGVATTWGAEPFRSRVPDTDAVVVQRLNDAGAVLAAKLTLGALAYGDIWYGGRTNNPWNIEQGSSGSSAGSAAATAAGLVGFTIGTETYGSIVSPCMRCGTTGLRPTFGRVARTGAMALCWSLDKIGPICRTVEDSMAVLSVINGGDPGDPSSLDMPVQFDARRSARGMRIGYDPSMFDGDDVHPTDTQTLNALRGIGVELVQVALPRWNYDPLITILYAEAAAAFEKITLDDTDDLLKWQENRAWPNTFRQARFLPAIEVVQADRLRRQVMGAVNDALADVDALISPSFAGDLLLITNNTGHPSLTIRNGFSEDNTPHGITLWGRLYEEGALCTLGMALERELGVWDARPVLE